MIGMEKSISKWKILLIALLILLIVLASEMLIFNSLMAENLWTWYYHKGFLKTAVYVLSYLFIVAFLVGVFLVRSNKIFILLLVLITLPYLINISYYFINGYGFGISELQIFIAESTKFSNDVWISYSPYMIKALVFFLCIVAVSFLVRLFAVKNEILIKTRYVLYFGIVSIIIALAIIFKTINTINKYPVYAGFYTTIIYYLSNPLYYGERDKLTITPESESKYQNIIWIIDESISYNYLSINGYEKETTPYLGSIKEKYVNLGRSSSISNCSAMTNIGLLSGVQLSQLPDESAYSLRSSSIFQYAKNAGYTTHYISGQSYDKRFQNHMTSFDLEYIDNFYQPDIGFEDDKVPEEDIISETKKAIDNNKKNFIFIVKRGAHFHWANQTPENKILFKPVLEGQDALVMENKEKAINSYSNTVKYRVDDFFKELFSETKLLDDESFIIYTSDHGQSILEGGSNGTHCDSTNPNLTQGIVPMLVFANKHKSELSELPKNSYSHYEIFPTTLELMGYQNYDNGYTFFNKPDAKQIFSSGDIFGRASFHFNDISKVKVGP